MSYTIEMLWKCSHCGKSGNKGLSKHCVGCGYPKDEKCEEYFPDDITERNALTGDKDRAARAGADWKCQYCGSLQSSGNQCCSECGCDKETGKRSWSTKAKTITEGAGVTERVETIDAQHSFGRASPPNGERPKPKTYGKKSEPQFTFHTFPDEILATPVRRFPWKIVGAVAFAVLTIGILSWFIFRTRIVEASVSDAYWEYRIHVDRWQVWHRDGWSPDRDAFDIRNEGERIHHYDKVVSGSHQEPYMETYSCGQTCVQIPRTCTSNQNGTATCTGGGQSCSPKTCTRTAYKTVTDYRDEPRYQTWYSWNVWDWGYNRTVANKGHDLEPSWPSQDRLTAVLKSGEKERQRREEYYQIEFVDKDKDKHVMKPSSLREFSQFPVGRTVRLKVGMAHGVEVLPDNQ